MGRKTKAERKAPYAFLEQLVQLEVCGKLPFAWMEWEMALDERADVIDVFCHDSFDVDRWLGQYGVKLPVHHCVMFISGEELRYWAGADSFSRDYLTCAFLITPSGIVKSTKKDINIPVSEFLEKHKLMDKRVYGFIVYHR